MKDIIVKKLHILIIILGLWGLLDIYEAKDMELSSLHERKPLLENKIKHTKLKLKEIKQFKKNLLTSKRRVKSVLEQLESVQKQLPTKINDTEIQRTLTDISKKLKIINPNTSPDSEEMKGFYYAKKYIFEAKGTFLQFLIFFEKLAESKRILNVRNVVISANNKIERARFQVLSIETDIESFRFNPDYREKAGEKDVLDVIK